MSSDSNSERTDNRPGSKQPERGQTVRILSPDERSEDMKAFGREIRKTKESAIDFLRRAGIVDDSGDLAEPYRS